MLHLTYTMSKLSIRVFPLDVTSYRGERVQKRFVQGSFVVANKVLKGVQGDNTRHLPNGAGGIIVKSGLYFKLNQIGNGFVRSKIWFIIMKCFWKIRCIS